MTHGSLTQSLELKTVYLPDCLLFPFLCRHPGNSKLYTFYRFKLLWSCVINSNYFAGDRGDKGSPGLAGLPASLKSVLDAESKFLLLTILLPDGII